MQSSNKKSSDLSTRFLAYTQLANKTTIRTGELVDALQISPIQERGLLHRLARSGRISRVRRGLYLIPPQLPAGRYSPGLYLILHKLMEDRAGTYQICGPSAFNFHGFSDQIANTTYVYNNRISAERTIGALEFVLIKVADKRLGSVDSFITPEGVEVFYSSKARTLVDAVYDWSRFNGLPRAYDWIRNALTDAQAVKNLVAAILEFGNQATIRRISYLLETMEQPATALNKLQSALNPSTALIPWLPTRPKRGQVNRKWGLVVNA